jgi:hypothetical protein
MSSSEWVQVDFQEFVNEYNKEVVIEKAPKILYSKEDKEHEAFNSLIAFLIVTGGLCIYIALTAILAPIYFTIVGFIIIVALGAVADMILILNYLKSRVIIKPLECWVEIFLSSDYYCFVYYPIFSGKCHPNKAKNVIYKLYQEEYLKSKIDITQIEVYLKKNFDSIGFFFQYGEGKAFTEEKLDRNAWKYFPNEKSLNENYLATANWEHQYEWRNDLALDFDKLHSYAQWVIKGWNVISLKPLTTEYKEKINWNLRTIDSIPKLKPWAGNIETQSYENKDAYREFQMVEKAIKDFIGKGIQVDKLKDLKKNIFYIQQHFREL